MLVGQANERFRAEEATARQLNEETREARDICAHWKQWREHWEHREVELRRAMAALPDSFERHLDLVAAAQEGKIEAQHAQYEAALTRTTLDIQDRLCGLTSGTRHERLRAHHLYRAARDPAEDAFGVRYGSCIRYCSCADSRTADSRLRALRRTVPRQRRSRAAERRVLPARLRGTGARARYRLRTRRVSGTGARAAAAVRRASIYRRNRWRCAARRGSMRKWPICSNI